MDVLPSRDQVVLFEPRADVPVSCEPAVYEMFAKPRQLLFHPVPWLLIIAAVVGVFLPGRPAGLTVPAVVAFGGVIGMVVLARQVLLLPAAEFTDVVHERPRRATLGEGDCCGRGRSSACGCWIGGWWRGCPLPT